MRQILVIGAGQSASFLIKQLLEEAQREDWVLTVTDLARRFVVDRTRADAIRFDINDAALRSAEIEKADVVVNMLLGIDHMSAMSRIQRRRKEGARILEFCSWGSGIPAPDQTHNPLRYVVIRDPRNVVVAGFEGAQYVEHGETKIVRFHLGQSDRIPPRLRRHLRFEKGYGEPFGIPDDALSERFGVLATREEFLSTRDIVLLTEPLPADPSEMREGATPWGWPYCVQQRVNSYRAGLPVYGIPR